MPQEMKAFQHRKQSLGMARQPGIRPFAVLWSLSETLCGWAIPGKYGGPGPCFLVAPFQKGGGVFQQTLTIEWI